MTLRKGSRVITTDTREAGTITYLWSTGEHADVWIDPPRDCTELIRLEDLELL